MRIDAHCHAWEHWPYQPPVPDPASRGSIDQLIHEMDLNDIDRAVLICAQIDHNPENNAYGFACAGRFPDRIVPFVDLDSFWSDTYAMPGAAARLQAMLERWPLRGFTHYLRREEDGTWLRGREGQRVFALATEHRLIASIAAFPNHIAAIREVARRFPEVPILLHHLGGVHVDDPDGIRIVLAAAAEPNLFVKISGYNYAARQNWDFPYAEVLPVIRALYEAFGPDRLCWGSDYPVSRRSMTYRQSIEVIRTHCDFITREDEARILGGTLDSLLVGLPPSF